MNASVAIPSEPATAVRPMMLCPNGNPSPGRSTGSSVSRFWSVIVVMPTPTNSLRPVAKNQKAWRRRRSRCRSGRHRCRTSIGERRRRISAPANAKPATIKLQVADSGTEDVAGASRMINCGAKAQSVIKPPDVMNMSRPRTCCRGSFFCQGNHANNGDIGNPVWNREMWGFRMFSDFPPGPRADPIVGARQAL